MYPANYSLDDGRRRLVNDDDDLEDTQHLKFTVCVPPNSEATLQLVARVGAPPLRVTQPIVNLDVSSTDKCRDFIVCEDLLEPGLTWLGIASVGSRVDLSRASHNKRMSTAD